MRRRLGPRAPAAIAALLLAGCGTPTIKPLPAACLSPRATFERSLLRAPAKVLLPDGTSLSRCVRDVRTDADLQALGIALTSLADGLSGRAATGDSAAALQLGYLVGAVRTGVAHSNGVTVELGRRIEHATALRSAPPAARSALARGLRAGEALG